MLNKTLAAFKEADDMKKHPENYKCYNSAKEMFEDIMKDQVGDYLNTFYHSDSTPEQRLGMVMNAYKGYRQKYYDPYWKAIDKSAYEGKLKFNGKDFDTLILR